MSEDARIMSLQSKHEKIEKALHDEEIRPAPDDERISHLKKEKLALKDEISRMQPS